MINSNNRSGSHIESNYVVAGPTLSTTGSVGAAVSQPEAVNTLGALLDQSLMDGVPQPTFHSTDPIPAINPFHQELPKANPLSITPSIYGDDSCDGPSAYYQYSQGLDESLNLHCPLTRELMKDPVTADDKVVYEREGILNYLSFSNISPVTGQQISSELYPDLRKAAEIRKYIESRQIIEEENAKWVTHADLHKLKKEISKEISKEMSKLEEKMVKTLEKYLHQFMRDTPITAPVYGTPNSAPPHIAPRFAPPDSAGLPSVVPLHSAGPPFVLPPYSAGHSVLPSGVAGRRAFDPREKHNPYTAKIKKASGKGGSSARHGSAVSHPLMKAVQARKTSVQDSLLNFYWVYDPDIFESFITPSDAKWFSKMFRIQFNRKKDDLDSPLLFLERMAAFDAGFPVDITATETKDLIFCVTERRKTAFAPWYILGHGSADLNFRTFLGLAGGHHNLSQVEFFIARNRGTAHAPSPCARDEAASDEDDQERDDDGHEERDEGNDEQSIQFFE